MTSIPPLIYPDTMYIIQEIGGILSTNTLVSSKITDNIATIENGLITNLSDPILDSDAANLNYLINSEPEPAGPNTAIQYTDTDGTFEGSSNFTFDGTKMTTDIINVDSQNVVIGNGIITGINNGTTSSSAVNKGYVDALNNLNESTLILNSSVTYSSNQMVNGVIYRDPVSIPVSNTRFDTTANASSIIGQFENTSVGNSCLFYIKNITSSNDVYIYLKPGSGVNFNNSTDGVTIPQNYILKSRLIIQSPSTVLMYIESISYSNTNSYVKDLESSISLIPYSLMTTKTTSFKNNTALFMNYYDDESLGSGPLTWLSILNGQVYRNSLSSDITLFFPEPASFLFTNVGTKGYYRFIIRNGDPTYTITLVGSNGWVLDPNASFVIQPMTSLLLWLYLFTDSSGNETINIYVIGRMDL